jgi:hypothetical protein
MRRGSFMMHFISCNDYCTAACIEEVVINSILRPKSLRISIPFSAGNHLDDYVSGPLCSPVWPQDFVTPLYDCIRVNVPCHAVFRTPNLCFYISPNTNAPDFRITSHSQQLTAARPGRLPRLHPFPLYWSPPPHPILRSPNSRP